MKQTIIIAVVVVIAFKVADKLFLDKMLWSKFGSNYEDFDDE